MSSPAPAVPSSREFVLLGITYGLYTVGLLLFWPAVVGVIMVNLLTSGGPGSTTEVASITLKREAFEKWRTGYSSAFAIILFVAVFGLANIYVKALNRVKAR